MGWVWTRRHGGKGILPRAQRTGRGQRARELEGQGGVGGRREDVDNNHDDESSLISPAHQALL